MTKLVVVDCNYLCHRARFTTGPLSYKDQPTGVIFGFLNQLAMIGQTLRPDNIAFTWDSRRSLRRERYSFYKDRSKTEPPDQMLLDAFKQFSMLRQEIIPALGFKNNFMQDGYEADDIMAQICLDWSGKTVLTTSDDDMLQVLSPTTEIYNLGRKELVTFRTFRRKYGIKAQQWSDVKQIAGCPSDTIPGIPGVGEKTAIKFLTERLKPSAKTYQAIISPGGREIIKRNRWLVDLPLPGTKPVKIKPNRFDKTALKQLCKQYGFSKWLNNPQWIDDWEIYFG